VRVNYRPSAKFSIAASETCDRFRLPLPNGNFSVVLASLQGNYSLSRFLAFTSLIQMDTSNSQAVIANLRLLYNYRPDSDLYIIYNVGRNSPALPQPIRRKFEKPVSPSNTHTLGSPDNGMRETLDAVGP